MQTLPHALSFVALIAGTLEYAILMRHREDIRRALREREAAADGGLQGLVRILLAESDEPTTGRSPAPGT